MRVNGIQGYGVGRWVQGFEGISEIPSQGRPLHDFAELLRWLESRKREQHVQIELIPLEECQPWYYDAREGRIRNQDGSFFRITGLESTPPEGKTVSQPVILQQEIGYLGIVCRKIHGIWHFLMQAKIEPGNINYVQISPTIQATKSNFTRRHGGKEPPYLDLFRRMRREDILVDQIQSEQSSRFWGKRNRNVIIKTEEDIPELPSHRWMTLAQIRECMKHDNLVNMDTRTVLSCIPYVFMMDGIDGYSEPFVRSMRAIRHEDIIDIFLRMNNTKMFHAPELREVPLLSLPDWGFENHRFRRQGWPFEIVFCRLNIEGREVARWNQPLFAAQGRATFGLICRETEGRYEALIRVKPEIGCFDAVELGPSVQEEAGQDAEARDSVACAFFQGLQNPDQVLMDVVMSEEGGRFYHEQNRNVILRVDSDQPAFDPDKYIWVTLGSLNALTQINNCLNIQLRNLLMLLSMHSMKTQEDSTR